MLAQGLECTQYLISGLSYSNGRANLSSTSTVNYSIIDHKISDNADSIMECSFGLVDNLKRGGSGRMVSRSRDNTCHLIASTNKYCHRPGIGAFLDDKHLISCGAEGQFAYNSGAAKLLSSQVFETGNDATLRGNRD